MIGRDCVWNAFRMKKQRIKQVKQQVFRVERVFRRCSSSFGVGAQFKWGVIGGSRLFLLRRREESLLHVTNVSEKRRRRRRKQSKKPLEARGPHVTKPLQFRSCSIRQAKTGLTGAFRIRLLLLFGSKVFSQGCFRTREMPARRARLLCG